MALWSLGSWLGGKPLVERLRPLQLVQPGRGQV